MTPESGPAGTPVQLKGRGLATTGRVVFAIDRMLRRARFKVVSDEEIEVLVPECYRPGAAATVAVFTESGAAVAMPATVQTVRSSVQGTNGAEAGETFYHVQSGGVVMSAESVAVIEKGGVVVHSTDAAMHFVKNGGTLLEFDNRDRHCLLRAGRAARPWCGKAEPAGRGHARQASRDHGVPGGRTIPVCGSALTRPVGTASSSTAHSRVLAARGRVRRDHHAYRPGICPHECSPVPGPSPRLASGGFPRGF